jgi:hypothetical protein
MAALISLKNGYDTNHQDIGLRDPSQQIDGFALAANTSERIAIPAGASRVIISATANIAVLFGTVASSAAMPTDITNGTGSELNPSGYLLDSLASTVTHLCVISDATCLVSLAWYKS